MKPTRGGMKYVLLRRGGFSALEIQEQIRNGTLEGELGKKKHTYELPRKLEPLFHVSVVWRASLLVLQ